MDRVKVTTRRFHVQNVQDASVTNLPPLNVKERERREPPPTMPKPPFMAGVFGSRGAGKTTLMINLIRMYDSVRAFDHVIVFSPTFEKDPKFEALQNSRPHAKLDLIPDFTVPKFTDFLSMMDSRIRAYDKFKKATEAFQKFQKRGQSALDEDELLLLYQYDFTDPVKHDEFPDGPPSFLMVFDDMVGNKQIYRNDSSGPVGRFALRHRHYGCSVMFMSQAYNNGIPRQLRNNLNVAVFFANKSDKIKMEVAEEMASHISPDEFVDVWNFATREPYSSFMVIFDAERDEWRFRRNFDTLIFPAERQEEFEEVEGERDSDQDVRSPAVGSRRGDPGGNPRGARQETTAQKEAPRRSHATPSSWKQQGNTKRIRHR